MGGGGGVVGWGGHCRGDVEEKGDGREGTVTDGVRGSRV